MIFLMTKDSFLLQGFWQLKDNHEMIKINSLSEIKKVGNKPFKVIIDTYHNHILDEEAIKFLEKLDAERIIVLAPYHISKLKAKAGSISGFGELRGTLNTPQMWLEKRPELSKNVTDCYAKLRKSQKQNHLARNSHPLRG